MFLTLCAILVCYVDSRDDGFPCHGRRHPHSAGSRGHFAGTPFRSRTQRGLTREPCRQRIRFRLAWYARLRIAAITGRIIAAVMPSLFVVLYHSYGRAMDERLKAGAFGDAVNVYAGEVVFTAGTRYPRPKWSRTFRAMGYTVRAHVRTFSPSKNTLIIVPSGRICRAP